MVKKRGVPLRRAPLFFVFYIENIRGYMNRITALLITFTTFLMFNACATSDPRGYQPIEIGNTANETQMVREGRDTQTYMMSTMPTPSNAESTYMGEMPEAKVHYEKKEENIQIDNKIDFGKI